jgi:hypothetical protein
MEHCRLTTHVGTLTTAAIDSIIERGALSDWIELRAAALVRPEVFAPLRQLCQVRAADLYDPFADGHRAWLVYMDSGIAEDENCSGLRQAFTDSGGQL